MTRDELVILLADYVAHKHITGSEMAYLLALYDSGELTPSDMPSVPERNNDWLAALLALLLLANINVLRSATVSLPLYQRRNLRLVLRGNFETAATQAAYKLAAGQLSPGDWFSSTWQAIRLYSLQMAIAGAGHVPSARLRATFEQTFSPMVTQFWRFGMLVTFRDLIGRPMSTRLIASRTRQYGGPGWAAWFEAQGEDAAWGYVEQWISRDDQYVCRYCASLHRKYFLPGDGPMPGRGCYGTCRCVRVPEYNPDVYARLTGERGRAR